MKSFAIKILLLLFITLEVNAQVKEEWVARYNGPPGDRFDIVTQMILDSGNVYIVGNSVGFGSLNDIIVLKYSAGGSLIWEFRYNGPFNSTDDSKSAAITPEGNIVITGFTATSSFDFNLVTLKINSSGDSLWTRIYSNPNYSRSSGEKITVDDTGNIYVAGSVRGSSGFQDIVLLKYSPNGEILNETVYSGSGNRDDLIASFLINENSELYITGTTQKSTTQFDILLLKYSSNLQPVWQREYNNSLNTYDGATASVLDSEGNVIITGRTTPANNFSDVIVLKYSPAGDLLWLQTYNGPGNNIDIPFDVTVDASDNILVTGYTRAGTTLGTEDVLTLKYSPSGNLLWERTFNGVMNGIDQGFCITTDATGNVYVGGAMDKGDYLMIYLTMKYSPDGDLLWYINYDYSQHTEDFIYFIEVDDNSAVYVTGISFGGLTDYDIATIKYSQTVGVNQVSEIIPAEFKLYQNFPNPFNPVTKVRFEVVLSRELSLYISDINGKLIDKYFNRIFTPGVYEFELDLGDHTSGIYFITLKMNGKSQTIKSILAK